MPAEADMAPADLERANSKVAVVEGRNVHPTEKEALCAEIEAIRSFASTLPRNTRIEVDRQYHDNGSPISSFDCRIY
ncbi:hypothetical protein BDN67DRAFT_971583 [Paxillus ammoniavirescens]|nr:hypothetical protein BDN67DRAFT_971583 [Paxillus ammoniavirescens]